MKNIFRHLIFGFVYLVLFCAFGSAWPATTAGAEVVDRIVAVVNDDIITLYELNRLVQPYIEQVRALGYYPEKEKAMIYKVREDMLDKLIDDKVRDQEIDRFKLNVSEKEIDDTIERIKEANYYTDEDVRQALAAEGLTMEEYRERIKQQVLRSKLVNLEIKSKIVITQDDIKAYYEKNIEKYGGKKKYHLRNIIMQVPPFANEDMKNEIQAKMEMVLEKLEEGEPFETMVVQYSESPLAAEGGDLGLYSLDQLAPILQSAIKDLNPGDYTPVIDTDQGLQIFLVEEVVEKPAKSLEEVAPEIERVLFNEIINEKFQDWIEKLRAQSHIKKIQ